MENEGKILFRDPITDVIFAARISDIEKLKRLAAYCGCLEDYCGYLEETKKDLNYYFRLLDSKKSFLERLYSMKGLIV